MISLNDALDELPYIAILRGVRPDEVISIGEILVEAGVRAIEIPMNSPDPFASIELLSGRFGRGALVGCGTVTTAEQLRASHLAGARLVLHPHADRRLVVLAKELGMESVPGVTTPTEAFGMLEAGADALKFFPSEVITPIAAAAIRAVLPRDTVTISVGGVSSQNIADYWAVGVTGFGLGSSIYKPGWTADRVATELAPLIQVAAGLPKTAKAGSK